MSYVIIRMDETRPAKRTNWAVGHYEQWTELGDQYTTTTFHPLFTFKTVTAAARMVHYLNGGNEPGDGLEKFLADNLVS